MITDESNSDMVLAHQELLRRLGYVLKDGRRKLDKYLMGEMFQVVKTHREQCRDRHLDFPHLVAIVIPRLGIVEWSRADLDATSIRTKIVNFVRDHPTAQMLEVVSAFKAAWPSVHSDDFATPADNLVKGLAKKAALKENPQ